MPKRIFHPVAHLYIDPQMYFLRSFSAERKNSFLRKNANFSRQLRLCGVPTIHIARCLNDSYEAKTLKRSEVWPTENPRCRKQGKYLERLGLLSAPTTDELVFVKKQDDAFHHTTLKKLLDSFETHTLVVTGLNTCGCVEKSINGAAREGFSDLIVVYDLLADSWAPKEKEADPLWHKDYLTRCVPASVLSPERIITAGTCINLFKQAAPLRPNASLQGIGTPSNTLV